MRKITAFLLITFLSTTIAFAQKKAKTPLDLLKTIYKLAKAEKYDKLNKYLYQGKVNDGPPDVRGKKMNEVILAGIKQAKDNPHSDRYSAQGLKKIITEHANRITPISDEVKVELFGNGEGAFSQFTDLQKIADEHPNDIYIFDYSRVHILMAKMGKGFKLVFWEGLDKVLRDKKTIPGKAKGGGK